jgi:ABC-2 type transport system ATP-binding protein
MNEVAIRVQGLTKSYSSTDQPVLKDLNFEIFKGELVAYIGPNGSGKSTTIKTLTGILPDFEGNVQVLGMDISKQAYEVKQRLGYIPENAVLYESLTPSEYLYFIGQLYGMPTAQIKEKSMALLNLFDLADNHKQPMSSFSKGMRQKVLLIAGMLHNPEIIFLDEPLSGLDANAVILVKEILSRLKAQGKTLFYSSHLMDVVEKVADRIFILHQGRIAASGTFAELKQNQEGSLEQIFTQLTGIHEYQDRASQFVEIVYQN